MTKTIEILVADDHPIVREGLVTVLNTQEDFSIVGEARDGKELVAKALQLRPHVILTDLEMPELDGVEAIKQLNQLAPDVGIVVFTAFDTDERIVGAIENGAKGYLLKGAPRQEIFRAVRVVSDGGSLLEPKVANKLIEHMHQKGTNERNTNTLTEREMEVLHLLAQGLKNKVIGEQLFITERTVKFYVSAIMGKLDADNRTDAVRIAAKIGLIEL